ncbi:MAG: MFS transporter [Nitrosomonadaceae bacterium]|nr:MFS transporter [Nitrosomonadaceae bacterium]
MPNTEDILQAGDSSEMMECGAIPHQAPANEWSVLAILVGVHFIHIMDFMIMMPLGPQFMRLFEITPPQFGFLVSIYTFSAGLCGFFAAFVIDRFDRKTVLMVLCGGFAIATLLCALAPNYPMLLAARAVAGAFGGVMGAMVFSIVGDIIPEYRRGAATGTVMSAFSLAAVVGLPIGLFLANLSDWRAPFFFLTALGVLIIAAAWWALPPLRAHLEHQRESSPLRQLRTIFFNRNHLNAFALIIMLMFAGFSVIPFISLYMVANVGLAETDLPYLYFFGGLATFFTARWIGRYSDHHGKRKVFGILAVISIAPILLVTHLSKVPVILAIGATTLFMIFVSGRFVPAMALIISSVEPRLRGSFMSFNSSVQQIAAGFASLMAGSIMGKSAAGELTRFGTVGIIAAVSTLVCIFLTAKLRSAEERSVE